VLVCVSKRITQYYHIGTLFALSEIEKLRPNVDTLWSSYTTSNSAIHRKKTSSNVICDNDQCCTLMRTKPEMLESSKVKVERT